MEGWGAWLSTPRTGGHWGYLGEAHRGRWVLWPEGSCSGAATDLSPWSLSSSPQPAVWEINCRDQNCACVTVFLHGSKYQILVVDWYLQSSAVSATAFQAEAVQIHDTGFGNVLYLWKICIWCLLFRLFEPLVPMCDLILGIFSNLNKSVRFLHHVSY